MARKMIPVAMRVKLHGLADADYSVMRTLDRYVPAYIRTSRQ